jgi:hypothetical protein
MASPSSELPAYAIEEASRAEKRKAFFMRYLLRKAKIISLFRIPPIKAWTTKKPGKRLPACRVRTVKLRLP